MCTLDFVSFLYFCVDGVSEGQFKQVLDQGAPFHQYLLRFQLTIITLELPLLKSIPNFLITYLYPNYCVPYRGL